MSVGLWFGHLAAAKGLGMGYLLPAKITLTWRKECVISSYAVAKPASETINDCCNTPFLSSPIAGQLLFRPRSL